MSLRLGRVAATHPEDNSVDLVMIDDGSRLSGVQVITGSATTNSGVHDLPTVSKPASGDQWSLTEKTDRDMTAIVGFIGRAPVVLGFLFPQVSQMLFKDERRVMRHASDVYTSIDGGGNFEFAHPGGFFLRVATNPAHEDLTGKDVDGNWAISKNTGALVHFHLELPGKWSIDIAPADGAMVIDTQGPVTLTAAGPVTVNAPAGTTVNGPLTVNGLLTYTQGMAGSGGGGAAAAITGNVNVTGGNVVADGIGLKTHDHTTPVGPPVP